MNGQRFSESIRLSIDFLYGAEAVGNLVQGYTQCSFICKIRTEWKNSTEISCFHEMKCQKILNEHPEDNSLLSSQSSDIFLLVFYI